MTPVTVSYMQLSTLPVTTNPGETAYRLGARGADGDLHLSPYLLDLVEQLRIVVLS